MSAYQGLVKANSKASRRDFTTVFFSFAFPLIFLLIFGLIFRDQAVGGSDRDYIEYIAPGVLSWGVANAVVFSTAFQLMSWRDSDLLRLIRLSPSSLASVFGSRFTINIVIAAIQVVLFIAVASLPIFGLAPTGSSWELLPMTVGGVLCFSALGVIIGSIGDTPEAVAAISNCLMIPMAFLSGSFLPMALLPGWLQDWSGVLPLRYLNEGYGNAIGGYGELSDLMLNVGATLAFGLVFVLVGAKIFRWSNNK